MLYEMYFNKEIISDNGEIKTTVPVVFTDQDAMTTQQTVFATSSRPTIATTTRTQRCILIRF